MPTFLASLKALDRAREVLDMNRTLTWALFLTLALAAVTLKDAPRQDLLTAEDGTPVPRRFYDVRANLAACDSLGLGGTDFCECLADPQACKEYDLELYDRVFGGKLETYEILEVWSDR